MSHALCSCDLRTQSTEYYKRKLNFYLCPLKNIKFDPIHNL